MKNAMKLLGIVILTAAILTMTACGPGDEGEPGILTIINFKDSLTNGNWIMGGLTIEFTNGIYAKGLGFYADAPVITSDSATQKGAKITGNTITLYVYEWESNFVDNTTFEPYTGNLSNDKLFLGFTEYNTETYDSSLDEEEIQEMTVKTFSGKNTIIFRNGSATLDFDKIMKEIEEE